MKMLTAENNGMPTFIRDGGGDDRGYGANGGMIIFVILIIFLFLIFHSSKNDVYATGNGGFNQSSFTQGAQNALLQTSQIANSTSNAELKAALVELRGENRAETQAVLARTNAIAETQMQDKLAESRNATLVALNENNLLKQQLYSDAKFNEVFREIAGVKNASFAEYASLKADVALKPNAPALTANCCVPLGNPTCGTCNDGRI